MGFAKVFGIPVEDPLLPPEIAADGEARRLLKMWSERRAALDEVIERLASHMIERSDTRQLIDDLLAEDDRVAVHDAISKARRAAE